MKTIIVGTIEFLNRKAIIHSISEMYQAYTKEELDALEDTFYQEGVDYLVVEEYFGEIVVTNNALVSLLKGSWGSNNPSITNNATNEGGQIV